MNSRFAGLFLVFISICTRVAWGVARKFKVDNPPDSTDKLVYFCIERGLNEFSFIKQVNGQWFVVCADEKGIDAILFDTIELVDHAKPPVVVANAQCTEQSDFKNNLKVEPLPYRKFRYELSNSTLPSESSLNYGLSDQDNCSPSTEKIAKLGDAFKTLYKRKALGSVALLVKKNKLVELENKYKETSHEAFPYELKYKARSLPNDCIELSFSPLLYISQTVRNPALQTELDKLNSGYEVLKLNVDPPLNHLLVRNTFDTEMLTALIEDPKLTSRLNSDEVKFLKSVLFDHMRSISYEELFSDLQTLTSDFKRALADRPYSIVFNPRTSTQWLGEIGVSQIARPPAEYLSYYSDTAGIPSEGIKVKNQTVKDYVFFDDFAYSGDQVYQGIFKGTYRLVKRVPPHSTIYLVMPYLSTAGKNRWEREGYLDEAFSHEFEGRRIKLISTGKTFSTPEEILSALEKSGNKNSQPAFDKAYKKFVDFAKTEHKLDLPEKIRYHRLAMVPEWKMPDRQSVDLDLLHPFVQTNAIPVYKRPKAVREALSTEKDDPTLILKSASALWLKN